MELIYKNNRIEIFFDSSRNVLVQKLKEEKHQSGKFTGRRPFKIIQNAEDLERIFCYNENDTVFVSKLQMLFLQWYAFKVPRA